MTDDPAFRPETLGTYEPTTEERIEAQVERVRYAWELTLPSRADSPWATQFTEALDSLAAIARELAAENARLRQPREDDTWTRTSVGGRREP